MTHSKRQSATQKAQKSKHSEKNFLTYRNMKQYRVTRRTEGADRYIDESLGIWYGDSPADVESALPPTGGDSWYVITLID